jgi:uncharacterized membrane protein YozB (DUF420 family)
VGTTRCGGTTTALLFFLARHGFSLENVTTTGGRRRVYYILTTHTFLQFLKVLLRMRSRLHHGPSLDLGGHFFPFLAVQLQSRQKGIVFFFGPTSRMFLTRFDECSIVSSCWWCSVVVVVVGLAWMQTRRQAQHGIDIHVIIILVAATTAIVFVLVVLRCRCRRDGRRRGGEIVRVLLR